MREVSEIERGMRKKSTMRGERDLKERDKRNTIDLN